MSRNTVCALVSLCKFKRQSIPMGIPIVPDIATHVAIIDMLNNAKTYVDMAIYYFNLLGGAFGVGVGLFCPVP